MNIKIERPTCLWYGEAYTEYVNFRIHNLPKIGEIGRRFRYASSEIATAVFCGFDLIVTLHETTGGNVLMSKWDQNRQFSSFSAKKSIVCPKQMPNKFGRFKIIFKSFVVVSIIYRAIGGPRPWVASATTLPGV